MMANLGKTTPEKSSAVSGKASAPAAQSAYPLATLRDEMDRLFDNFFQGWPTLSSRMFDLAPFKRASEPLSSGYRAIMPKVDVSETEEGYEIQAELPGLDEKDVGITVSDGVLTIKGEKKAEREEKKKDYHLTERSYGMVQRSFELPDSVDADKISAKYAKGVLSVSLPKSKESKSKERKIAIAAS